MKTILYQLASLHTKLDSLTIEVRQNSEVIKELVSKPMPVDYSLDSDMARNSLPITTMEEFNKLEDLLKGNIEFEKALVRCYFI